MKAHAKTALGFTIILFVTFAILDVYIDVPIAAYVVSFSFVSCIVLPLGDSFFLGQFTEKTQVKVSQTLVTMFVLSFFWLGFTLKNL